MTPTRRVHLLFAALLAASLVLPGVAAEHGEVSADKVRYRGGAHIAGGLAAFYFGYSPDGVIVDAPSGGGPVLDVRIRADQFEARAVDSHYIVGPPVAGVSQPVEDPRYDPSVPANRTVLQHALAQLVGQQSAVQMHILPQAVDGTIPFTATSEAGQFRAVNELAMGGGTFHEATPTDGEDRTTERPDFWSMRSHAPLVMHEDLAGAFSMTFTGDCVLEIVGGTFDVQGQDKRAVLESGVWETPLVGGGLPLGDTPVHAQRVVLLRLFLTGATIDLSSQGGVPFVYFATPAATSDPGGESVLLGATGSVEDEAGKVTTLANQTFTLGAGNTLQLTPDEDRLAIVVAPAASPQTTSSGVLQFDGQPTTVMAIVAVLALAAAVAMGVLRPSGGPADLHAVEAAIEAQRYGRAARLAKRILRVRPGLEDAVLGRAIALSKSGRAGTAIAELHAHLASRGATDGSLHYVLGLAFLDVGRVEDARAALGEAVRLTPALAPDVSARLGPQASSPPTATLREVHGYA